MSKIARIVALKLEPEKLSVVLEVIAELETELEAHKNKREQYLASERARKAAAKKPKQANEKPMIKFDTPQWVAWVKYRGKPFPESRSGVWQVETEWPPGYGPNGTHAS